MKTSNILIVSAVIVVVGGVAALRTARERGHAASGAPAATEAAAHPAPDPATPAAETGGPSPEAPPGAEAGDPPAAASAATATAPAAGKKLPRLVDLGADKCKACRELAPILAELRTEYAGRVLIEFIDVWKDPGAGEPYKIRVIPTQVFFDAEGREIWRHEGFLPKAAFVEKFAELGVK